MKFEKIKIENISTGDYLTNLGFAEKVDKYSEFICVTIENGFIISAAFYWFKRGTVVTIEKIS